MLFRLSDVIFKASSGAFLLLAMRWLLGTLCMGMWFDDD